MAKTTMSDETRFLIVIILLILSIPLLFYLLDRFQSPSAAPESRKERTTELTVVVSDADKKTAAAKISPQSIAAQTQDAIHQGNYSTAHLQLKKVAPGSPEYKEMLKAIVAANLKGSEVKAIAPTAKTPLRYVDESTPRDRGADALYLYVVESTEAPHLWFCIQAYGEQPLKISGFKIKAGGKTLLIRSPAVKTEKIKGQVAEFYDAPLTKESYAVVRGVVEAREATLVYLGATRAREHKISEKEQQGLSRILELYEGLGGSFSAFTTE